MKQKIINADPEILSGRPVFFGTRVPVKHFFDYLEGGESVEEFLKDFPTVERDQIEGLLKICHELVIASIEVPHEDITG